MHQLHTTPHNAKPNHRPNNPGGALPRQRSLLHWLCVVLCAASFLAATDASAGPWSKAPGHFYTKLSQNFLWSSDTNNQDRPGVPYFGTSSSFYGEIGIFYGLQVMAFVPFTIATHTSRSNPNEFYTVGGFGDANFGLQWTPPPLMKLLGFPMALRVDFKVPFYDVKMAQNNPSTSEIGTRFPFIGDGQVDMTIWLSAGGGIPNTNLYLFGEIGYRIRTSAWIGDGFAVNGIDFQDTIVIQFQAGYNILKRVLVMLNFNAVLPTDLANAPLVPVTKGYLQLGLGVYIPIWKGLAAEASFDPVFWAFRVDRSVSFSLGLSYSY